MSKAEFNPTARNGRTNMTARLLTIITPFKAGTSVVMAMSRMSMSELVKAITLIIGFTLSLTCNGEEIIINLGTPLSETEISKASITIFPDGQNLPAGQGTVSEGEKLYLDRCALCHGESATEGPSIRLTGSVGLFSIWDPLRIQRIQNTNALLVMSTGQQWPYATSLFDFIRRAMPHVAPKSLSNNEVYALTAYILNLNDLLEDEGELDRENLPLIEMPAFKRYVQNWQAD